MVKVYLPMGYPIQTGLEFETIVFQNNLVRSYTVPKDPRTETQLFERRFLSDVAKMRSYLGAWGKGALKAILGRTWATVLYQLVKSDSFSWWSDATDEWNGFTETGKDAWREAAPYKVTFNDMGWIFFGLSRVIYRAFEEYSDTLWFADEWSEEQSANALIWWNRLISGVVVKGVYDNLHSGFTYHGSFNTKTDASLYNGSAKWAGVAGGAYVDFYFYGNSVSIGYYKDLGFGNLLGHVDGRLETTLAQGNSVFIKPPDAGLFSGQRGLHYCRIIGGGAGYFNLDSLQIG